MLRHAYRPIIFPVDTSHPQISFELRNTNYELFTSVLKSAICIFILDNERKKPFICSYIFNFFSRDTDMLLTHSTKNTTKVTK